MFHIGKTISFKNFMVIDLIPSFKYTIITKNIYKEVIPLTPPWLVFSYIQLDAWIHYNINNKLMSIDLILYRLIFLNAKVVRPMTSLKFKMHIEQKKLFINIILFIINKICTRKTLLSSRQLTKYNWIYIYIQHLMISCKLNSSLVFKNLKKNQLNQETMIFNVKNHPHNLMKVMQM